jgi:predicted AlkP superfamily pyrophosphatase or phosphodiesterase
MKRVKRETREISKNRENIDKNIFAIFVYFACFAFYPVFAQQTQQKQENKPKFEKISSHIVVVSISGLRADDVNGAPSHRSPIPTIQAMRAGGAHAVTMESVYPSLTNPSHATMITGTLPADHGVTSDFPFNEQTGAQSPAPYFLSKAIKTAAIWEIAKRGGYSTAAVGFPLTAGAAVDFNIPINNEAPIDRSILKEFVNPPDIADRAPLLPANVPFVANEKLKEIGNQQRLDDFKSAVAGYLIRNHRPNLLMINFSSFAAAELKYGILSVESKLALEFIDRLLKTIVESIDQSKLADETTLFVVSDYGAMKIEQTFSPNRVLAKKGWLTVDGESRVASWRAIAQTFGGSAAVFVQNPQDEKTVREVEKLFAEYHEKPDSPIWRIVNRREAGQLGADPRAAFYLDAAPFYAMSPRIDGSTISKSSQRAAFGYLPSRSEMRATLIMSGKGIKSGSQIEYARLIDLAPTIARLLGLEMRATRGRVLSEVISK